MINRFIPVLVFGLCMYNCSNKVDVDQSTFEQMVSIRNLGLAYLEEERNSDAVEEFQRLIEIAPKEPLGFANLGLAFMRMNGMLQQSEDWLTSGLKLAPDNPDIRLLTAELYQLTNRQEQAIEMLENTLVNSPNHLKTLYELALSYSKIKNIESNKNAIKYMRKVVDVLPSNLVATFRLVELLLQNDNPNDALKYLEIINQTLPRLQDGANELFKRILILLKNGEDESAYVPFMMLHNLLKPTSIYRASIEELEGTNGPFSGSPIYRFLNTNKPRLDMPNPIPNVVKFIDITESIGITSILTDYNSEDLGRVTFALGDYDLDGDEDLFVSKWSNKHMRSNQYFFNNDQGLFSDISEQSGIKHTEKDLSSIFADYNNDGYLDLFIINTHKNRLYKNLGDGSFELSQDFNLENNDVGTFAVFSDLDLEGDLDLFLTTKTRNYLYRYNSDGTYIERGLNAGLNGENSGGKEVISSDFDDDGDIDLFILNQDGNHQYFDNLRQGYFENNIDNSGIDIMNVPGSVISGDYDNDGDIDLFISDLSGEENQLFTNNGDGTFRINTDWGIQSVSTRKINGMDSKFLDIDNDGYLDILIAGKINDSLAVGTGLQLLYNNGLGKFIDATSLIAGNLGSFYHIETSDYDDDGDIDLFLTNTHGNIQVLRNDGGNLNNYLTVRLKGLRTGSGKNNYFGIGSKIEIKSDDLYQLRYVDRSTIHFGLGEREGADVMRILWNNGVPQNHFNPTSNQTIVEEQFLKGSCPYLFGWTGSKFEFLTDVLWPSALGMPLGIMAGETLYAFPNSTAEYLMVPKNKLIPKNNNYIFQFTTELWETPYLDKIKLVVIDHPDTIDVLIDEKFSPPPYPSSRIYNFAKKYIPISAEDHRGNNVLNIISKKDKEYVSNFLSDKYQGVTELHDLIIGFEDLSSADSLFLFLQGWLFPTDASINVNLAQSHELRTIFPSIEVLDRDGNWVMAIDNIGFPKGKNKTMIIDLTNQFFSNDYRLRIRTNMQIYWDHIFIASKVSNNILETMELKPIAADLHYRGFSEISRKNFGSPHIPDYYNISTGQKWRDLIGTYTKYGDVLPLLIESDNKYVIMNAGDEITLKFDASSLPDVKENWSRDFLFYNDGWLKDGDLNTAHGQTVDPLPFHGMASYPYEQKSKYFDEEEYINFQKKYKTRNITTKSFKEYIRKSK